MGSIFKNHVVSARLTKIKKKCFHSRATRKKTKQNMDLKTFNLEVSLGRLQKICQEMILPAKCIVRILSIVLDFVSDLVGRVLGSTLVRGHFHLLLSGMVLFGPLLCFWVSKYNIFANSNHFLYR